MLVSFVNAGLLTLTQAAGVIMGANVGTTTTAWLVSLAGYKVDISVFALPIVGIGFLMRLPKWKYGDWGEALLGFGFLFIGLEFINNALPRIGPDSLAFIDGISQLGFVSVLIGLGMGTVVTLLMHSSAATITLTIALAYREMIDFPIAASMILGANVGTTIDAIMAAIGTKTAAKQTALVHVFFNVAGSALALVFFRPMLQAVDFLTPGSLSGAGVTTHLAMFHTVFNAGSTILFLPFVKQIAAIASFFFKDKKEDEKQAEHYKLEIPSGMIPAPEFNIVMAEKEIRDMAGLVADMYAQASEALIKLSLADTEGEQRLLFDEDRENPLRPPGSENPAGGGMNREDLVNELVQSMKAKEDWADEMREELTRFLIEVTRLQLSPKSEYNISQLLRIIADLEDMADDCCGISMTLERSVKKNHLFKRKEIEGLTPYVKQVEEFLSFVRRHLGHPITGEQIQFAEKLENTIDKSRNKLRKLGRKRIMAGADVKMELLFIDLVRRIERLGDFCYNISEALFHMN
jgi:phosphate:Na+ symporter